MPTPQKLLQDEKTHPSVIVVGRSIDEERPPVVRVIIEKKTFMEVDSVLEGILCCFCSYYVFGLKYPKSVEATLEFVQRVLLDHNPPEGIKRVKCQKTSETPTTVHPLVRSFLDKYQPYEDALYAE